MVQQYQANTYLRLRDAGQASSIEAATGPTMTRLYVLGPDRRPAFLGEAAERGASWSVMGSENKRRATLYREGENAGMAVWDRDGTVRFEKP